ncbi:hypothetical protein TIFTF001_020750 [Ficus carica]|uniref:Uncharacterized protein n=1 Tax=Ficus carica TaxID=3494 RepID=A0AA88DDZ6_FICCA|nr:hypothetical protein TIFTF001_020750 [Ficus carica]
MGIIPLRFKPDEDAETLELTGHERYTIDLPSKISNTRPCQDVTVTTRRWEIFYLHSTFRHRDSTSLDYAYNSCD